MDASHHNLERINKWATLSAGVFCQYGAGLTYTFAIYSDALKQHFGYSQQQVQGLGSAANVGGYLAILSGLFYDATARWDRAGPQMTLAIGATLNIAGYLALWAAATGRMSPAYWQMGCILAIAPLGTTFLDNAALVTCAKNFPSQRGTAIGLVKAAFGLSASLYTSLYSGFLAPDATAFLLLLAILPTLTVLSSLHFVNYVPYVPQCEDPTATERRLWVAVELVGGLGLYSLITAVLEAMFTLSKPVRIGLAAGTVLAAAAMLLLPYGTGGLWAVPAELAAVSNADDDAEGTALQCMDAADEREDTAGQDGRKPLVDTDLKEPVEERCMIHPKELGLLQSMLTVDFWLLFFVCTVGMGTGLMFVNNLGQLVLSLGSSRGPAVFISIFSVSSCFGRLLLGYGLPRPHFLTGTCLFAAATAMGCAFASYAGLYAASIFTGLAFGSYWTLAPVLTSEWFGLRAFASNLSLLSLAPALGSYLLASQLTGSLYDREAARQKSFDHQCTGSACFRAAFLTCAVLCLLGAGASIILYLRTRALYLAARQPGRCTSSIEVTGTCMVSS